MSVDKFFHLCGEDQLTIDVHSLIRLSQHVQHRLPLDNFIAFLFDSHKCRLKQVLRSSALTVSQFMRRCAKCANVLVEEQDAATPHVKFKFTCVTRKLAFIVGAVIYASTIPNNAVDVHGTP